MATSLIYRVFKTAIKSTAGVQLLLVGGSGHGGNTGYACGALRGTKWAAKWKRNNYN